MTEAGLDQPEHGLVRRHALPLVHAVLDVPVDVVAHLHALLGPARLDDVHGAGLYRVDAVVLAGLDVDAHVEGGVAARVDRIPQRVLVVERLERPARDGPARPAAHRAGAAVVPPRHQAVAAVREPLRGAGLEREGGRGVVRVLRDRAYVLGRGARPEERAGG